MAATCEQLGQGDREPNASERGSSLVAILSVVATLGVLVAITLSLSLGTSTSPTHVPPHATGATTTTTTIPKDAASGATQATLAACEANFAAIDSAVETYRALNGTYPPAGTAWATSDGQGGPLVQSWPSGAHSYRLVWDGHQLSVIPAKGTASHGSIGQGPDVSGCFAAKTS
jgi:hypothetical protein